MGIDAPNAPERGLKDEKQRKPKNTITALLTDGRDHSLAVEVVPSTVVTVSAALLASSVLKEVPLGRGHRLRLHHLRIHRFPLTGEETAAGAVRAAQAAAAAGLRRVQVATDGRASTSLRAGRWPRRIGLRRERKTAFSPNYFIERHVTRSATHPLPLLSRAGRRRRRFVEWKTVQRVAVVVDERSAVEHFAVDVHLRSHHNDAGHRLHAAVGRLWAAQRDQCAVSGIALKP